MISTIFSVINASVFSQLRKKKYSTLLSTLLNAIRIYGYIFREGKHLFAVGPSCYTPKPCNKNAHDESSQVHNSSAWRFSVSAFFSNHLLFNVAFPSRFAAAAAFDLSRRPQPRRRSRRLQHVPKPGGAHRGRGLAAEDGRVGVGEAAAAAAAAARTVAAAAVEGGFAVAGQFPTAR